MAQLCLWTKIRTKQWFVLCAPNATILLVYILAKIKMSFFWNLLIAGPHFGCIGFSMYFCAPNATILLVYIPAKIKISFIWKDDFFLSKSASSVSRSQALVLGALSFQCMRAGFLCPKCDNFACLHTCQDQNELHLKRWFFFANIGIFSKSIAGPLSEAYMQPYSFGRRIKLIIC